MDTWSMIARERSQLADALEALPPEAFDRPSLCGGWTVRDVLAHMTATAQKTPVSFFSGLASNRLSFERMVSSDISGLERANDDGQLLALWRARVGTKNGPPGPSTSWLGEAVVHGEDIFRSLGAYREHPEEHLVAVADFYKGSNLIIGAKRRIAGLSLRATDTGWRHGDGPEVSGPHIALVLAMAGRPVALDDLSGEGLETLRARL